MRKNTLLNGSLELFTGIGMMWSQITYSFLK